MKWNNSDNGDNFFGHIFDLAENAVTNLFYNDDTFSMPKHSEKSKLYHAEKILFNRDDDSPDIENKIRQMKRLGKNISKLKAFYAEAEYMKDITDCYSNTKEPRIYSYLPLPDMMTVGELRSYYTWRTKIMNGKYEPTYSLYTEMFVTEAITGIHGHSPENTVLELVNLIKCQTPYTKNTTAMLCTYLTDYIILNNTSFSYEEIRKMLADKMPADGTDYSKINRNNYCACPEALAAQSSYKFMQSKLLESKYGYLLPLCIDYVFHKIEEYLHGYGIDLFNLLYEDTIPIITTEWFPYNGNRFIDKKITQDFDITLPNGIRYMHKYHKFTTSQYKIAKKNILREAIGYVIKLTEAKLRNKLGFKPELKVNQSKVTVESPLLTYQELRTFRKAVTLFIADEMTKIIQDGVSEFYLNTGLPLSVMAKKKPAKNDNIQEEEPPQPAEINIDETKLDNIRAGSDYLRSVLVTEEISNEIPDDTGHSPDNTDCSDETTTVLPEYPDSNITPTAHDTHILNEYEQFFSSLDNSHREMLKVILDGSDILTRLNKISSEKGLTVEMMLDSINEKALDCIGDNIIDTNGEPFIYEDYINEINQLITEEK